jgi:uncharacterized protein
MMPHTPRPPEAIAADRARYEEHQRRGLTFAPKSLPTPSPVPAPPPVDVLREQVIAGGWYGTFALQTGEVLRLQSGALAGRCRWPAGPRAIRRSG